MIIVKALYGLKSSGLRWHERLAAILLEMEFIPSRADPDVWLRSCGDHYEYIGVYVDDLEIASKDPQAILDTLSNVYHFNLKGSGPISFHLGCDFNCDPNGTLCMQP